MFTISNMIWSRFALRSQMSATAAVILNLLAGDIDKILYINICIPRYKPNKLSIKRGIIDGDLQFRGKHATRRN